MAADPLIAWVNAQEWAEVTTLPAEPHEAALMYLATLAHPGDWSARSAAVWWLIEATKLEFRETRQRRPEWSRPRARPRDVDRQMDRLGKLVLTRIHAAQASALRAAPCGGEMAIHGPASVREIVAAMRAGRWKWVIEIGPGAGPKAKDRPPDYEAITNAISREWAPSKCVLHLARALQGNALSGGRNLDVVELVLRPEWLRPCLKSLPAHAFHVTWQRLVVPNEMIWLRQSAHF